MAWLNVQYEYSIVTYDYDRLLMWLSADTHCYFAAKKTLAEDWTYFAGDAGHALVDSELTNYGTVEADAQTNYLQTAKDSDGRVRVLLPAFQQAKYWRVYIDDMQPTILYEFWPETFQGGDQIDYLPEYLDEARLFTLAAIMGTL